MQAYGQRRQLAHDLVGAGTGFRIALAPQWCHDLFDQTDLAVSSGLDSTQMAGLDAVTGHLGNGARDDQRVAVEVSSAGLGGDQPELLELGEGLLVDACSIDQFRSRQANSTPSRETRRRR